MANTPRYRSKVLQTDVSSLQVGTAEQKISQANTLNQRISNFIAVKRGDDIRDANIKASLAAEEAFMNAGATRRIRGENEKSNIEYKERTKNDESGTIYSSAYNAKLNSLLTKQTLINASSKAEQYAVEHYNDPVSFDVSFNAYREGIIRESKSNNQAEIALSLASIKSKHMDRINARYTAEFKEKEAAINAQADIQAINNIEASAYGGYLAAAEADINLFKASLQERVNLGDMDEGQRAKILKDTETKLIFGSLQGTNDRLIQSGDFETAQQSIDKLRLSSHNKGDKAYRKFNNVQRDQMAAKLQSDLNRAMSKDNATRRASDAALNKEVNSFVKLLNQGKNPDLNRLNDLMESTQGSVNGNKLQTSLNVYQEVRKYIDTPPDVKSAVVNEMRNKAFKGETTPEEELILKQLDSSLKEDIQLFDKSPLQLGSNHGVVGGIMPLNFSSAESLTNGLLNRTKDIRAVEAHYDTQSGAFTPTELDHLSSAFVNMTAPEKMNIITSIGKLPQDIADKTYEQLNKKGWGEFSIIGTLMNNGNNTEANLVMAGRKYRSFDGYKKPSGMDYMFNTGAGMALDSAPAETRNAYMGAIESAYLALVHNDKDEMESFSEGDYSINDDMYKQAVDAVIGGTVTTDNGSTILAPKRGMKQDDFEDWFDEIDASDFPNLSTEKDAHAKGVSYKDIISMAKDAKVISVGKGKYFFKDGAGATLMGNDGNPLMLLYREY